MNLEKIYLFIVFFGILLFFANFLLIYLVSGLIYLIFYFLVFVSIVIFLFFILYLRIQHNIEISGKKIDTKITDYYDELVIGLKELKSNISNKFEEQEQIYEEILDLLEKLTIDKIKKR